MKEVALSHSKLRTVRSWELGLERRFKTFGISESWIPSDARGHTSQRGSKPGNRFECLGVARNMMAEETPPSNYGAQLFALGALPHALGALRRRRTR